MTRARGTTDLEAAARQAETGRRVVVRRGAGKRVAVVPAEDLDRLEALDREEDADLLAVALAAEAEARAAGEEPVPWSDVKRRLGLA